MRAFPTIALAGILLFLDTYPAHSQILRAAISKQSWGINNPGEIQFAQVSVMRGATGDSLLIYALRDMPPPTATASIVSRSPSPDGKFFVISDFSFRQQNTLGGMFDTYQRSPSAASAKLSATNDDDRALHFTYDRKRTGFCGLWIHLFSSTDPPQDRIYLDVRPYDAITFWIRGEGGNEHLSLKFADARWIQKDDAVSIGDLDNFVRGGRIDTVWRLAVIPFDVLPKSLNPAQLGSVVFEADSIGNGRVELKTLALTKDRTQAPLLTQATRPSISKVAGEALWVWETAAISKSVEARRELVDFLVEQQFARVFLGIPYEPGEANPAGSLPVLHSTFGTLLRDLHAKGIKVEALLGDPNLTLPKWHPFVLSTLKNIIRYNRASSAADRFDGIHLDVEPYLLPGFGGPRNQELVLDYLELLAKVCRQAHRADLTVGADIPFWYSEPDEFTQTVNTISFRGSTKPIYQHILDVVDEIAVMSYRTSPSGMDGIVAHNLDELNYAQRIRKTVYVGLETGPIPDERIVTFRGRPLIGEVAAYRGEFLFAVASQDSLVFYLVGENQLKDFQGFVQKASEGQDTVYSWTTGTSTFVPGSKLSFASLGLGDLGKTTTDVMLELGRYKSFGGFAIHYYSSYRKMFDSSLRDK